MYDIANGFDIVYYILYFFFNPASIISYILVILETVVLALIKAPMFGLRFVPIYGQYYFWKITAPYKKVFSILYIITAPLFDLCMCLFIILIISALNDSEVAMSSTVSVALGGVVLIFIAVMLKIAAFVFKILINLDAAENFLFNRYLGILFALIPVVGDICYIVNAKKAREAECFLIDYE